MYWNDNYLNGHAGSIPPLHPSFLRRSLLLYPLAWLSLIRPAYFLILQLAFLANYASSFIAHFPLLLVKLLSAQSLEVWLSWLIVGLGWLFWESV